MADTSTELERIYTIPLRKAHHGTRSKRANRAVRDVRVFLTRHMKADHVWLAGDVNEAIWSRGKFKIPSKLRVRATRFSDGVVEVTLPESEAVGSVREELAERREKAAESPVLAPFEGEEGEVPGATEPVTAVTGIGPATAEKLEEKLEIETVADFLEAGPDAVAEALGKDPEAVEAWFESARELAEAPPAEESDDSEEETVAEAAADSEE